LIKLESRTVLESRSPHVVHIVDDEAEIRDLLMAQAESAGLEVMAHASAEAFLAAADLASAGCVVTDVRMPGMGGLNLLANLRENQPTVPVIIITAHGDVPMAVAALKAGATDFIEKPFSGQAFRLAVSSALATRRRTAERDRERQTLAERRRRLTDREAEVMDLVVGGMSNNAAAEALGISVRTVENHRARLMDKMQANNLSDLVRMALAISRPDQAQGH
jgi:two-component system response regulator FixJ